MAMATIAWYRVNFTPLSEFGVATTLGTIATHYGVADSFPNKLRYWLGTAQVSFLLRPLVVAVVILELVALITWTYRLLSKHRRVSYLDVAALVAVLELIAIFVVFSLEIDQDPRFLLPGLPYVSVLVTWGLSQVRPRVITPLVAIGLLSIQWLLVYAQALGLTPPSPSLSYYLWAVDPDTRNASDVEAAVQATCSPTTPPELSIVGVELPWMNAVSVGFFASKRQLPHLSTCKYASLGYAEADPDRAWALLESLSPANYISVDPKLPAIPDDFNNQVTQPVLARVQSSPSFHLDPLDGHPRILVYKRSGS
jgi:hypothetical protein